MSLSRIEALEPMSRLMRPFAQRAWVRAGTHGDRAFLVIGSSYWNEPRISQHDVARTFARRGPTIFLEPAWKGNRRSPTVSVGGEDPTVVSSPAIPRGIRYSAIANLNLLLGLAAWRALAETAPSGRRLVTWALEFRFAPLLERSRYRPSFIFHNVDVQTDGRQEGRMAALSSLCACPSSIAADVIRSFNANTIAIGHGVTHHIANLAAAAAGQRGAQRGPRKTLGFVGLWDTDARIDVALVRRLLSTYPELTLEVTTPAETISDLSAEFPGRVRPLGFLAWADILRQTLAWDAAVVPYDTRRPHIYYSCPYKLFPLLSAGLPVICVDIIAVRGLAPHLFVADSTDQFVALAGQAIRGEIKVNLDDAASFRNERMWDRILDRVVSAYDATLGQ